MNWLDAFPEPSPALIELASKQVAGKGYNVLFVDDEADAVEPQVRIHAAKFSTYGAKSAFEARKILEHRDIYAIVADLYMPEESGIELLKWCAENKLLLARVLWTASEDVDAVVSATNEAHAHYIVRKPYSQAAMDRVIRLSVARSVLMRGFRDAAGT